MDLATLLVAFGLGFAAALVRLPPLVGYLAAGFVLHAFGYESTDGIDTIADLGIYLLLFGIGLKLRIRTLARPEVWGAAGIHMALTTGVIGSAFLALGALGLPLASGLTPTQAVLVGFAFSFSSTVFAVKALEVRNEAGSIQGRIAIGILVIQDVFAVVFLTLAVDEPPSIWAIPVVVGVIAARPIYGWILNRSGHGELLILFGIGLAIGVGAGIFEQVGLKPDLGALVVGLTLASHPRSAELAETLLGFKDILLIGFFLSVGLGGVPGPATIAVVLVALAVLPIKTGGYLVVLSRFRLRSRTAWHASATLASHSEFGLIVAAIAVEQTWLDQEWASAIAVAVALSFALASPVNAARYSIYHRWSPWLARLERHPSLAADQLIEPVDARIIVFGMGRVGSGAYDELVRRRGHVVLGIDRLDETVVAGQASGRVVVRGDALDFDFWDRMRLHAGIELVVFATGDHPATLEGVRRVKEFLPNVRIAASATFSDEVADLKEAGVHVARNLYGEAGQGLADDACDLLDGKQPD